jgi:hypothetical protein
VWEIWVRPLQMSFFFSLALQPHWALASAFSASWLFLQTVQLLGRVISSSQGLYLNTGQHKHRINTYTHQTSMPCVGFEPTIPTSERAKISTCLRPLGYRDRPRCRLMRALTPWKHPSEIRISCLNWLLLMQIHVCEAYAFNENNCKTNSQLITNNAVLYILIYLLCTVMYIQGK